MPTRFTMPLARMASSEKKAEALETIKKAFAAGYGNPDWAANDPDLICLQDDPDFQKLVGSSKTSAS